mmetsp:Transcript_35832/g.71933  ORF Transcript_35832/g.71933 Transcript_35832/m.71933 type:complete len:80 (+) Transcript_35832:2-241(+)
MAVLAPSLKEMDGDEVLCTLLGNIANRLPHHPKVLEAMLAVKLPRDAQAMLDQLTAEESVQEFKRPGRKPRTGSTGSSS